jgi:hypothetical protein
VEAGFKGCGPIWSILRKRGPCRGNHNERDEARKEAGASRRPSKLEISHVGEKVGMKEKQKLRRG